MPQWPPRAPEDVLLHVIAATYEAAVAPDRWPHVLEAMRQMFDLGSAAYIAYSPDLHSADGVVAGVDPQGHRAMLNTLFGEKVFYRRGNPWHPGHIVRGTDVIPNRVFHRSRIYQEYWRPRDLYDGIRLTVSVDDAGVTHAVNLIRPRSGALFHETDIARAYVLMPHLRRAMDLQQRIGRIDMLASAALASLDLLRHAVLLLDHARRLLHANAAAHRILAAANGLGARQGVLHAATATATDRLQAALAAGAGAGGKSPRASALRLPRRDGNGALAVLVMPFHHEAHWSLSRRPAVLVCVSDHAASPAPPGWQLIGLFGLTGSEATLAADLLAGKELREIAEARGRSINTVRTLLSRLMAKMDVNRQADLVRRLAALPRAHDQG